MSTEPTTNPDYDLDEILRLAYPQATALLAREHGMPLLRIGARALIASPQLALEALGPRGVGKLGRALLALGQQHVAVAERMLEMEKAGAESTLPKAESGRRYNTEFRT